MRIIKTGFYSKLKTGVEVKQSVPTGITEEYKIRNVCIPLSNSSWGGGDRRDAWQCDSDVWFNVQLSSVLSAKPT